VGEQRRKKAPPVRQGPGTGAILRRLAANIRQARHARGLTQTRLAEKADLSVATLQDLEKGRYNTTILTLLHVAEALEVSLDALVRGRTGFHPPRGE
jgi:transcriptional regulator with XRE-family HTH domain